MLRICGKEFLTPEGVEVAIVEEQTCFGNNLWKESRKLFQQRLCDDITVIWMLPIVDENRECVCYGWQDEEANRELRMLRELGQNREALQFGDVFPKVKEVVVYGCNELAYNFVKYLETQQVKVFVSGKYWNYFGYESIGEEEVCSADRMVIHAEGFYQYVEWRRRMVRSVSAEFECIDRIYEANVLSGKIKDAGGEFEWLLTQLKGRKVAILGTGAKAQDTYDLLYMRGIDVTAFVEPESCGTWREDNRILLGRRVSDIAFVVSHMEETVFVSCTGKNSALGTELIEKFDYYGYERNRQFFLIDDYTDIPYSNLVHVLKGRKVVLAGEVALCRILQEYLEKVEDHEIEVKLMESGCYETNSDEILCIVHPWSEFVETERSRQLHQLREKLNAAGSSYTEYFSYVRSFVIMEEYLGRGKEKYTAKQLKPKGILLGAIPAASGNSFVRGVLDGHPDVLMLSYSDWNENLYCYCICLAREKSGNILESFEHMADRFMANMKHIFSDWDKFKESMAKLLLLKEQFTSQELFLMFHIAYAAMTDDCVATDISEKVIYWEPHHFNRMDFPFLAKWLEDQGISGNTLVVRRDGITYCGSQYKLCREYKTIYNLPAFVRGMSIDYIVTDTVSDRVVCSYWKEIKVRFEDLKLHPSKELSKICESIGISWSDTMMHTTLHGNEWAWGGVKDFDLKPVFNKYEEFFSEFDRFRISIICSLYQKKYGYVYEDCTRFSRVELWEMFLKEFRFQQELQFTDKRAKVGYFLAVYAIIRQQLWNARKHLLLDDIMPEFSPVEIGN